MIRALHNDLKTIIPTSGRSQIVGYVYIISCLYMYILYVSFNFELVHLRIIIRRVARDQKTLECTFVSCQSAAHTFYRIIL